MEMTIHDPPSGGQKGAHSGQSAPPETTAWTGRPAAGDRRMTVVSGFFRALADPTRLRILGLLLRSPRCVCEMAATLDLPQPLVSRHLAYLRNSGLVEGIRQGFRVNYEINDSHPLLRQLRPCLEQILREEPPGRGGHHNPNARIPAAKDDSV
jgi:ArsR family transcriptional regulator